MGVSANATDIFCTALCALAYAPPPPPFKCPSPHVYRPTPPLAAEGASFPPASRQLPTFNIMSPRPKSRMVA